MSAVVHVTHEAVRKIGGIGAVLEGLITARAYRKAISRSLLVGPMTGPEDEALLDESGRLLYSARTGQGDASLKRILDPVALKFDVNLAYGFRRIGRDGVEAEVLLVDATFLNRRIEENFKHSLYVRFGLRSDCFDDIDDYRLFLRMAEPGFEAAAALLDGDEGPHYLLAHEYMGMPAALKALMAGNRAFRTVFYAHEVATVRPLVESSPGHDTMFYNVMDRCLREGLSLADAFGDQSGFYRHELIARSRHCDRIFAVGDFVRDELRFLGTEFDDARIDLVYNGVVGEDLGLPERLAARDRLGDYAERLLGYRPDVIFSHVTRPVVSKGIWRDLRVMEHLDGVFHAAGQRAVMFLLSSAVGSRSGEDVLRMEAEYGWPILHRQGPPDLVGPESDIWADVDLFNRSARAIQVVFVNQFGWDSGHCGSRMPEQMTFADLRHGTDAELGQSTYEPFGIAQLEPLGSGALSVLSSVCGCTGFLSRVEQGEPTPSLIVADYVSLHEERSLGDLRSIGRDERDRLERERSWEVARTLAERLPKTDEERGRALERGKATADAISWEKVCEDYFLPGLAAARS